MENLDKLFTSYLEKINDLQNGIVILSKKNEIPSELNALKAKHDSVQLLVGHVLEIMNHFKTEQMKSYAEITNKLRNQQFILLNLISKIDEKNLKENRHPELQNQIKLSTKASVDHNRNISEQKPLRMFIDEYENSPYVKKVKPISLHFLDFDALICHKSFEKLPKYMRGRDTVDELNDFLQEVIVPCFTDKYILISKPRDSVKIADKNVWIAYRQQDKYFPGKHFITQGDLSRSIGRLIDKKMMSRITMLKHLYILKESRKESTICYLWNQPQSQ